WPQGKHVQSEPAVSCLVRRWAPWGWLTRGRRPQPPLGETARAKDRAACVKTPHRSNAEHIGAFRVVASGQVGRQSPGPSEAPTKQGPGRREAPVWKSPTLG